MNLRAIAALLLATTAGAAQTTPPPSFEVVEGFGRFLHDIGGNYFPNPVVNATNLTQAFDFDFKWTPKGQLASAGPDGISIFDAVQMQLGLKLEKRKRPMPVLVIDHIDEKPAEG